MSIRVTSPFPDYALPRVWTWCEQFRDRVSDDFAPATLELFVEDWERRKPYRKTWAVWRVQELGGLVVWEPGAKNQGVGLTHAIFKPSFWGHETTREALKLIYGELFASGVRKILGFPFRTNAAIIALGKSMGARTEGVLKAQTIRRGQLVDQVVLSLFKEDFEQCLSTSAICSASAPAPSPAA